MEPSIPKAIIQSLKSLNYQSLNPHRPPLQGIHLHAATTAAKFRMDGPKDQGDAAIQVCACGGLRVASECLAGACGWRYASCKISLFQSPR